jgi:hypothetical protein
VFPLSLFHKLLIVLALLQVSGLIAWRNKHKRKAVVERLEKEAKRWLEREIKNLYRIMVYTHTGEVIQTDPILPTAPVSQYNLTLAKNTSLASSEKLIESFMKRGYFRGRKISIPIRNIKRFEIIPVEKNEPKTA